MNTNYQRLSAPAGTFNQCKKTAIALGVMAMMSGAATQAQTATAPAKADGAAAEPVAVIVTGQRAALQSAQKIKQNSDEIVDSSSPKTWASCRTAR